MYTWSACTCIENSECLKFRCLNSLVKLSVGNINFVHVQVQTNIIMIDIDT